jgi:hypothetical protein
MRKIRYIAEMEVTEEFYNGKLMELKREITTNEHQTYMLSKNIVTYNAMIQNIT